MGWRNATCRAGLSSFIAISIAGCYTGLPDRPLDAWDPDDTDALVVPNGDEGSTGSSAGGPASSSADTLDDDASTGEAGELDEPRMGASEIVPTGLIINQGVAIAIAQSGTPIVGETRSAPVVHGRRSLVYATWSTTPSFVPRTIRAELHLVYGDDTEETLVSEVFVDGPSGTGPSDPHFEWALEPEQLLENTQWSVTLHEIEGAPEALETPDVPTLPAFGLSPLDDAGRQKLRIVFIPYRHQRNGCNKAAPSDATTIALHRQLMEMTYPTQQVELTLHAERVFTGSTASLDALLTDVLDLRAAESPAPDVYYYGSIWPCDQAGDGGLGYVPYNPETLADAPWRVSVGVHFDFAPEFSRWTMVHEIGHNHGRNHVFCSGQEGSTDPNYPFAGGTIGVLGWGIHDGQFRQPTSTDYMTYCTDDMWSSSYAWRQTFRVIDALTVAVGAGPVPPSTADAEALAVALRGGTITAATHVRGLVPRRDEGRAQWHLRDGRTVETVMQRDEVPDSDAQFFTIAVPAGGLEATLELELPSADGAHTVVRRDQIVSHR